MKKRFSYNLEWKCGQCRSEIRHQTHVLCRLILIYTVHKTFDLSTVGKQEAWIMNFQKRKSSTAVLQGLSINTGTLGFQKKYIMLLTAYFTPLAILVTLAETEDQVNPFPKKLCF